LKGRSEKRILEVMGAGRGAGGPCPLEIWGYIVFIRKPKEKKAEYGKAMEKMCVAPSLTACQ
jgi:hypothetical protein